MLNNDRKIFLIEEAAHGLQYAPGNNRMPVLVTARTANWDHGLIDRHTPRRSRLIAVLVALGRDTYGFDDDPSPPPKLVTLRRTAQRSGAFVLLAKDQSPLFCRCWVLS